MSVAGWIFMIVSVASVWTLDVGVSLLSFMELGAKSRAFIGLAVVFFIAWARSGRQLKVRRIAGLAPQAPPTP